jgi:hypothetical protein
MEALQRDAPPRHRAVDPPPPWEMAYLAALERFGVPSLWAVKSIRELIPCCVLVDRGVLLRMDGTGLPDRFHHLADASFSAYVFDSDVSVWPPLLPPLKGTKMSLESRKARDSQFFFWYDDLRIATADLAVQISRKSLDGIAFGEPLGVSAF